MFFQMALNGKHHISSISMLLLVQLFFLQMTLPLNVLYRQCVTVWLENMWSSAVWRPFLNKPLDLKAVGAMRPCW